MGVIVVNIETTGDVAADVKTFEEEAKKLIAETNTK